MPDPVLQSAPPELQRVKRWGGCCRVDGESKQLTRESELWPATFGCFNVSAGRSGSSWGLEARRRPSSTTSPLTPSPSLRPLSPPSFKCFTLRAAALCESSLLSLASRSIQLPFSWKWTASGSSSIVTGSDGSNSAASEALQPEHLMPH